MTMKPFISGLVVSVLFVTSASAVTIYNDHGYIAVLIIHEGPQNPVESNPVIFSGASNAGQSFSSHYSGSNGRLCYQRSRIWENANSGLTNLECAQGDGQTYKIN